jgi:hypothetical protein
MECLQCGSFEISRSALVSINRFDADERAKLSAWIRANPGNIFTTTELDRVDEATKPSTKFRADQMLRFIASKAAPGKEFAAHEHTIAVHTASTLKDVRGANPLLAIGWCADESEMNFMIDRMLYAELGYLEKANPNDAYQYKVSPKGWVALETAPQSISSVGFCAMWFHPRMNFLYSDVVAPAISEAGYEPLRIDKKEHANRIDDEIIAEIRASKFVVADCTGNRGGVYYEAGFAHGLGKPVYFLACEKSHLHFDIRQYNTIFWNTNELEDAKNRLKNRILATIGRGPLNT